jgi:hypothetical protein
MKFEKGQWVTCEGFYMQVMNRVSDHVYECRFAGRKGEWVDKHIGKMIPASLTPDFSGAKVGDECFDPIHGDGIVECIPNIGDGVVYSSSYRIRCKNTIYHVDSNDFKFQPNLHPALFNSLAQFMAYWQEEALKLKGGESENKKA